MIEDKYLTEDYGRTIAERGIVMTGLNSIDNFSILSDSIRQSNYPENYQFFLNESTYDKINELLKKIMDCNPVFKPDRSESEITSFFYGGIEYVIKRNQINNLNIGIPLNLNLVTIENSVIII